MKKIFMDHSSTTKVDSEVLEAMLPYFTEYYGNPSSVHSFGTEAANAVERAREKVARILGADADEIIFTAGGTEADNIAIQGLAYANMEKKGTPGPHIICSSIEHPAVLRTCQALEDEGFEVHYLSVDKLGIVKMEELKEKVSENTFLVTVMLANNETGTLQPMEELGTFCRERDIYFHTDAVQAVGKTPINVREMKIDLLAMAAHKMYGPKGVGAIYYRKGVPLKPILHGGGHEKGLRSSTLNVPGIVGLGKACELAGERLSEDMAMLKELRDELIQKVLRIEGTKLNGHPEKRLVNNAHFCIKGVPGEVILREMDARGIAVSTSSACSSKKKQSSHVLSAMGLDQEKAMSSVRFSIGRETTLEDLDDTYNALREIVESVRAQDTI